MRLSTAQTNASLLCNTPNSPSSIKDAGAEALSCMHASGDASNRNHVITKTFTHGFYSIFIIHCHQDGTGMITVNSTGATHFCSTACAFNRLDKLLHLLWHDPNRH